MARAGFRPFGHAAIALTWLRRFSVSIASAAASSMKSSRSAILFSAILPITACCAVDRGFAIAIVDRVRLAPIAAEGWVEETPPTARSSRYPTRGDVRVLGRAPP